MLQEPQSILSNDKDFLGADIIVDNTLIKLRTVPSNPQFGPMMTVCLQSVIDVLERQYSKYFALDITEKLREETASARSHNIDSEEIMGMFSAAQKKSPNATLCFLSSRMRSTKNKTVQYLDSLEEDRREELIRKAVKYGRIQRDRRRKTQKDLCQELVNRQTKKNSSRTLQKERNLRRSSKSPVWQLLKNDFPNLNYACCEKLLADILEGKVVGRKICHVWSEDGSLVVYNGLVRKLYANKMYKVGYWSQAENFDDATDFNVSMFEMASDLLHDDLVFSN
ncbi:hypothetical protein SNE40_015318 [Patella caerulea]|uniref:Uncharacterized protein n=1 Tax=Patella caerulea TaxID=87958 RepID=A0AAN8PRW1_PATCE